MLLDIETRMNILVRDRNCVLAPCLQSWIYLCIELVEPRESLNSTPDHEVLVCQVDPLLRLIIWVSESWGLINFQRNVWVVKRNLVSWRIVEFECICKLVLGYESSRVSSCWWRKSNSCCDTCWNTKINLLK